MFVKPKAGQSYRHTRTGQLVPAGGFEADPNDLDIVRALQCGDLVEADPEQEPEPAPVPAPKAEAVPAPAPKVEPAPVPAPAKPPTDDAKAS